LPWPWLACRSFLPGGIISRGEGILFLGYYTAYTLYLILAATHHDALPVFSSVMIWFVIPITVITLAVTAWQQFKSGR